MGRWRCPFFTKILIFWLVTPVRSLARSASEQQGGEEDLGRLRKARARADGGKVMGAGARTQPPPYAVERLV